jgi:4a-hydroxytetrahydrobiopterin dehydratase
MATLSEDEITKALAGLPGWSLGEGEIEKEYKFGNFVEALAFVNQVGERAEAANHHPNLDIRYNRVRVALSTHSEGGITAKDTALAGEIETLA